MRESIKLQSPVKTRLQSLGGSPVQLNLVAEHQGNIGLTEIIVKTAYDQREHAEQGQSGEATDDEKASAQTSRHEKNEVDRINISPPRIQ
jgi:hypothetical protein